MQTTPLVLTILTDCVHFFSVFMKIGKVIKLKVFAVIVKKEPSDAKWKKEETKS